MARWPAVMARLLGFLGGRTFAQDSPVTHRHVENRKLLASARAAYLL